MTKINLAYFKPIVDIIDNIIFANNGNVVIGYQAILPEIYSLSENDFEEIHNSWFQAIKSMPTGCVVHKQDIYLKRGYSSENLPNNSFLEKATHLYFKDREYIEHRSYLFFIHPDNKSLNNPKYVNPFRKINKGIPGQSEENLKVFLNSVEDTVSFINNNRKLELLPLSEKEIHSLANEYFNGYNEGFDTNIVLDKGPISIGENYFDVLAVNSELCFGESVQTSKTNERFTSDDFVFYQGFIDGLGLSLNENHIVNQVIYLDDKQKWRKLLDKKIEELNKSSNFGSQNKVVLKKIQHTLDQINADDTSRIIRGHLNQGLLTTEPLLKTRLCMVLSAFKTTAP